MVLHAGGNGAFGEDGYREAGMMLRKARKIPPTFRAKSFGDIADPPTSEPPPAKVIKKVPRFGFGSVDVTAAVADAHSIESDVENLFVELKSYRDNDEKPIHWWMARREVHRAKKTFYSLPLQTYKLVAPADLATLSVPATSATVERVFSEMTLHTTGFKGRTGPKMLQRRVVVSMNAEVYGIPL